MRYAIVSDVHANLESLERALAATEPSDTLVSLGDVVGYGPESQRMRGDSARSLPPRGAG